MTRDGRLRLVVAALATAGLAVACYLSYSRATDTVLICPTSGCGKVQQSSYSELAGVPVAYLGMVGYAAILASTFGAQRAAATAGATFALAGAAFAVYLLVAQLAFIHAVCVWCLTSDAILSLILAASLLRVVARARFGGRR